MVEHTAGTLSLSTCEAAASVVTERRANAVATSGDRDCNASLLTGIEPIRGTKRDNMTAAVLDGEMICLYKVEGGMSKDEVPCQPGCRVNGG